MFFLLTVKYGAFSNGGAVCPFDVRCFSAPGARTAEKQGAMDEYASVLVRPQHNLLHNLLGMTNGPNLVDRLNGPTS